MTRNNNKNYALVVFPSPPDKAFIYQVPEKLKDTIKAGQIVSVPFAKRTLTGLVIELLRETDIKPVKNIIHINDPEPALSNELLKLSKWIAEYYVSGLGETIKSTIPPGILNKNTLYVKTTVDKLPEDLSDSDTKILNEIKRKRKVSVVNLEKTFPEINVRRILSALEKSGIVQTQYMASGKPVSIKTEKIVHLNTDINESELESLLKNSPAQAQIVSILKNNNNSTARKNLPATAQTLNRLLQKGIIRFKENEIYRVNSDRIFNETEENYILTDEQALASQKIESSLNSRKFKIFLLYGVTGSGKTIVYMQAIKQVMKAGKSALVLIPEISLTPQAVSRYKAVFGDKVAVLHSRMSPGERFDTWRRIRKGELDIVLGPRSAVFAPLKNLGLIIVDEEHDSSFKQTDPAPRYNARDVAVMRGKLNNAVVILGSATPSFESLYNGLNGKYEILKLEKRVEKTPLPAVVLVDQKKFASDKETRIISPLLREKIEHRLKLNQQVILLQNRRGYSPFLMCSECGHIERCKNCDITLTFHKSTSTVECHYCGYKQPAPDTCPKCGNASFSYSGAGTEQIEEELQKLFPDVRTLRMDFDTTRRKNAYSKIIRDFMNHKADILLGTQMVAKGHDFPKVSLVGIISADTGLHFPDFRAGEKTFQLLAQAAGRAGRRNTQGEVIIQTMTPEHPVLSFVLTHNFDKFYKWDIRNRQGLNYPPFGRIILINFSGIKQQEVLSAAEFLKKFLAREKGITILGPALSPISRIKNRYRFQIIIKSSKKTDPSGNKIRRLVKYALHNYYSKNKFHNVRVAVNVDPINML